ncbi:MAG: flagellar basal body P-ring formation protein FlgA [Phreatobacter sp.]|uniref:flagellar basal body P-ring formation chaperone FlgA n=1 Tax=Phreatobacter sp. TaxID=1966341 RepID=UPI001A55CBC3|nr:flagellar basal body P-ring formation chaperone FlgA [Phreatobacter sp.]MBL8571084.1 flagellar basal body P-ring formation protein FlgA [Phreatobacter sp.]
MKRFAPLLALVAALTTPAAALAQTPALRAEVTVSADLVRLGDLLDNAGDHAQTAVFRSPDLGHTGRVPAAQVIDAARRAGLAHVAAGSIREVSVSRAARIVPLVEMEERIAANLARSLGLADSTRVQVAFDRGTRPLALELSQSGEIHVQRIDHDVRSGRFEAMLAVAGAENTGPFRIAGAANELVEFVVPARVINRGEVLRASDLAVERRPRSEMASLASDAVIALTQAVGMAARRPLQPERSFRAMDLMRPEIVERNGNVLILLDVPGLTLTVRGKALEAGAEGDTVQVQNLQSRKTLLGVVTGPGRVTVQMRGQPIVAASRAP